jgi:hypothetical protein
MTYQIVFPRAAQHEFAEAALWYEERSVGLGAEFTAEIARASSRSLRAHGASRSCIGTFSVFAHVASLTPCSFASKLAELSWRCSTRDATLSSGRAAPNSCRGPIRDVGVRSKPPRYHIANAELRPRVETLCRARGFEPPALCTPDELMGN